MGGDQTQITSSLETNQCATAGCHDLASTVDRAPGFIEDYNYGVGGNQEDPAGTNAAITTVGTWRYKSGAQYTGLRMSYSNAAGSSLTASFTGTRVEVVSDKDPYRGKADVFIDNVKVATIDCYSSNTVYQAVVFSSDVLAPGVHTISVRPLNQKQTSSRGTFVVVDAFKVYTEMPDSIAPSCVAGCHSDKSSGHGSTFSHEATHTAGVYAGLACTECHSTALTSEHTRTTSKTRGAGCGACHTTYAPYTLATYDFTCGGTGTTLDGAPEPCHDNAGEQMHDFADVTLIAADHTASDAASVQCRTCHGSRLDLIHDNSVTSNDGAGAAFVTSCLTCHGTDRFPETADCTNAGCHAASGVHDMGTHPSPAHNGTNAGQATVPRTGGKTCSTCHTLELVGEHAKASTSGAGGAVGCLECHTASYLPAGWLDVPGTSNTCIACHGVASGAPSASGAGEPHEPADYAIKHDFSPYGSNAFNCGGAAWCHNVTAVDLLHDASNKYDGDCTSCHTSGASVPTIRDCATCHTVAHPAYISAHTTSGSAECIACHTSGDRFSRFRVHQGDCAQCHDNPAYPGVVDGKAGAQCVDCHDGTLVGTHAYTPADDSHYTPALANHTAVGMDAAAGNKVCTDCHEDTLKAEHAVVYAAGGATGDGVVTCVECHTNTTLGSSAQVAADWTSDTCADCHTATHDSMASRHDLGVTTTGLGCSLSGCHAGADDIATMHLAAVKVGDPTKTSCNVCHLDGADARVIGVVSGGTNITGCDNCHANVHDMTALHTATASDACVDCHESAYAPDHHADCATCHDNASWPGLVAGKTADCVECHNGTLVGAKDYTGRTGASAHYSSALVTHTANEPGSYDGLACADCHELTMWTEHAKGSSAFNLGAYADKCVGCHEIAADDLPSAWSDLGKRCNACHVATHGERSAKHDATGVGSADGCGGASCHAIDDVAAIHDDSASVSTTADTLRCAVCHEDSSAVPTALDCGTAGCHEGVSHSHELGASAYDNATQTGCTNSGAGCHASNSTDYASYHPANGCLSGACHAAANHNDAQFDNPNTCMECHGGGAALYDGAPDAVALTDATGGHYSEATHAAAGLSATVSAGGTYSAACTVCHNPAGAGPDGLYVQHQGLGGGLGATTCSDCHNKNAAIQTIVTDATRTDTCAACHTAVVLPTMVQHGTTAPVVTGTEAGGAGSCQVAGCHATLDLHALHKSNASGNPNGCTMAGCHDATKQGVKPTATSCGSGGACHNSSPIHAGEAAAHTTLASSACVACHESGDLKIVHFDDCGACHGNATYPALPTGKLECVSCHNGTDVGFHVYNPYDPNHYLAVDHTADGVEAGIAMTGGKTCVTCHRLELKPEHAKSSTSFALGGYPDRCVACHELEVDTLAVTPWNKDCQACHATASVHGSASTAHDFTAGNAGCAGANCHNTADVTALHDPGLPGAGDCTWCHASNSIVPTERLCADCHAAHPAQATVHASTQTECTACHAGKANIATGHASCATCHADARLTDYLKNNYTPTCTGCHNATVIGSHAYTPADSNHYTPALANHTATPWTAAAQGTGADGAVPAGGKECSTCHTSTLKVAHATTSTSGGSVTCVECHTNATLGSSAQVAANWVNNRCTDCHDTGAARTHDGYATEHVVSTTRGCAGSGAGCHDFTDLAQLHAVSQSGGAPSYNSCYNSDTGESCHVTLNARPAAVPADSCGSGATGGCHLEKTTTNHGPDHDYTAASAYADGSGEGTEVGCAASGAGCHPSANAGDAVTTFHTTGASTCLSSACHTSSSMTAGWKAANTGAECAACHNGTFTNAVDTIALSDPTTTGHYATALHTATSGLVTVSAGGTASASCSTCHELSLKDGHMGAGFSSKTRGAKVTCAECHGYNAAVTAEVKTSSWATNACSDCHNSTDMGATQAQHASSAPVTNATTYTGCGATGIGCHNSIDLHAIHKDAASCTLSGCHAVDKDMAGAVKTCGQATGCHTSANYTATSHNGTGGLANGTDGTHHTAGANQMNANWPYNALLTPCSSCHSAALGTEHTRSTSTLSGAGANTCLKCHNDSATVAGVITGDWASKNTTSACTSCHANNDGTSAATAHGNVGTHATGTSVTGCTGLGAGCHGATATPDLRDVHYGAGCALTRACHSATVYNPGAKTCTNAACHPAATYNTTTYAHGTVNGTDATHQTSGMATTLRFGTGTATATCATCHSATLKGAHNAAAGYATNSLGAPWTSTNGTCLGCHNATSPINVAALVAANTWTGTCTGNGCHTTTQQAHVDGGTDAPAVAGVNSTTPSCTNTGCHATLELHELHKNAAGGCGLSETNGACHSAANLDKRPTQKTCGNVGGCHQGYQSVSHGTSNGGVACNTCHTALTGMVNDTSTYHHVLDSATPYRAPGAGGTYPTSKTAMECVSCHVDHSEYSPLPGGIGKGYSLRNSATVANPTASNTDDTMCLSCHTVNLARNTTGQKANTITETMVWDVNATYWTESPHNYDSPGPFNDGSIFYANCAKCHGTLQGTLSSGKFAVHTSAEQRLLNALGDTTVYTVNEEQMCFRCHSQTSDNLAGTNKTDSLKDWYGTQAMSVANVVIYGQMNAGTNTYGHKPHLYANKHLLDEADENQAYINANKHVECADCHNHHAVGDVRHDIGTSNLVSEALRGVTGQSVNYPNIATTNRPSDAQVNAQLAWKSEATYEYEICFKCHSSANSNLATWGGTKAGAVSANRWTNVAADFAIGNQSRHPVVSALLATDPSVSYGSSKVYAGQLIGIWEPGDTMYCSDCHGDSTAPAAGDPDNANHAQGPHGSSVAFSLRGPNTDWPINSRTGQPFTLNDVNGGDTPFCGNCHPGIAANKIHARNPTHKARACVNCHILIPHGGGMSRLMGDGDGAMPARYAYNNDKNTMWIASYIKRADPNTYVKGDCRVTAAGSTACGSGHTVGSTSGGSWENW